MGAQICSQNNQWSSHRQDVTPSSYPEQLTMPDYQAPEDDEMMEQYDNPTRGILDHNFLKTNITASFRSDREEKAPVARQLSSKSFALEEKTITQMQYPSVYRLESSQLSMGIDQWSEVFQFNTHSMEQFSQDEDINRLRQVSVQSRLKVQESNLSQSDNILRQVSDFLLTEKNVFEPIAISKEQFVKFRKDQIEKHYSFVEKIGEGTFGNVFKVYHKATKKFRAIKILKKTAISKMEAHKILKEVDILKKLDHPHIVKIYEVFFYQNNYYIVTEHCQGGSLSQLIKGHANLSIEVIRDIFKQLISALSYIHQLGIIHRDIKLDNILLMKKLNDRKQVDIRLIDFGLAKELKVKRIKDKEMIGTHTYMAPEVIEGVYSAKCDMWSAGVVLLNMIGRRNPFKGKSKEETMQKIKTQKLNFSGERWSGISLDVKQVIIGLVDKDSRARLNSEQILASKWLVEESQYEDAQKLRTFVARKFYDYYRSNNFVSIIESYIAYTTTTESQFQLFSRCFQILDENKNGFIETKQILKAFKLSSQKFSKEEIEYVASKVEKEHQGKINFSQFVTKLSDRSKLFARQSLVQAFDYLDDNNNGYLERVQLKKALKNLDCTQLSYIIGEIDENEDERISLEEFISYMSKEHSSS